MEVFGSSPTVGIKKEFFCMISIQVTLKAFEVDTLKQQTKVLCDLCQPSKLARVVGLPTKKKKFTVLRSPHIHKKSREQFIMQIQKTRISIKNTLTNFFYTSLTFCMQTFTWSSSTNKTAFSLYYKVVGISKTSICERWDLNPHT